ncbi:alpha-(1,6)-fucosyltransferase [Eurytemora carolleeae]|uniref:alpha-(1,6)-fucosyltransferase n=1 Tax=Eurytemora carolleeae TaxID=1294199 RepID=UPI000C782B44|nr:alpha-(1,6)-fucosyltransferase [Eurytemora carolleeae]XP_023326614.1 alpha-(1,6)-fucosyltransferase [Eurytemora carolleeae]XP_023326615.1 alpha-(1,6)-fucosyltransferase [Eurytemora carolleeae]|eukprot:XP_023326613.1 alpha-(1,6)-fucosyltransferase-like [Eurytemora affinis]
MRIFFNFGKLLLLLLFLWLLIVFFLIGIPLNRSSEAEDILAKKLLDAQNENLSLRKERDRALRELRDYQTKDGINIQDDEYKGCVPTDEYEEYRRRASRDVKELLNFARAQLDGLVKDKGHLEETVKYIKNEITKHAHVVLVDLNKLREHDGFEEWRAKESLYLSDLVQKRLTTLQNPEDCGTAKKLLCNLNKGCGYGCQIHHAVYCFITAYGSKRTMILHSKGWRYNKKGYQEVFQPVSETCTSQDGSSRSSWPGNDSTQIVELPIVDSVNPRPSYLPPAIPADLVNRLSRLHGDPVVWWLGQFLKYMLRPQKHLEDMLEKTVESQGFKNPVVGIHVRRTDKVGTEAAFHPVEEYMVHVEEWFDMLELTQKVDKRRVFVASDDPKVLGECRKKFSNYEFLGDQDVAKSAAVSSRYSDSSLRGVIQDIHLLSLSDFLVCTFSSQVCRIAYEIMQTRHIDAADRFKSLDDIFYFGGQSEHLQEAVYPHARRNSDELDLEIGDIIGVAGNHWNGLNKGRNHRTNRIGLYPEYKTKEKLRVINFP